MSPKTLFLLAGLTLLTPSLRAQAPADLPRKELTEATSESLGKLRPLIEAKNYDASLVLLDGLLAKAGPASFDRYVISQIKAQILLTQNKVAAAAEPLETALRLADKNANFYDAASYLEQLYLLAQVHYQTAADAKTPSAQKAGYQKALGHITRWFERSPRISVDSRLFAASLLYQIATLDPAKIDLARLREAMEQARMGRLLAVDPPAQLTLLLVGCHLQLNEHAPAAELLETLVLRDPKSATTWSQLQALYLARAADAKDPAEARAQNLRALHTLDRAQALGLLDSPKDRYTRVAILFNLRQYTRAAALLETGLADGTLENSKRNWELLASAYQQTDREEKALDALQRASDRFPADGSLEFGLAQALYGAGRTETAYERARSALAKGLENAGPAKVYLAYLAFELQRHEEAARWVADARQGGEASANLDSLDRAIADALAAREALRKSAG